MSRILHYDCFAGMSGDMNLAALIDLGVPSAYLHEHLSKLGLDDEFHLYIEPGFKNGMSGTIVRVHECEHDSHHHHHHRTFADIRELIAKSELSEFVKSRSIDVFRVLAEAEAEVHGKEVDEVHFHEVGATDSIVDIVGAVIAVEYLKPDRIYSTSVELGSGTVTCAHGVMPVPAPATLLLSRKFPSKTGGTDHEATTPTGAAFFAVMVDAFDRPITGICESSGVGLGHRNSDRLPNILRASLWDTSLRGDEGLVKECVQIETNIDDMTAEHLSHLTEKLFAAGAMDVWQEAIVMKKGRMGSKVVALASEDILDQILEVLFRHSSTLGARVLPVKKYEMERQMAARKTPYGEIHVKQAVENGVVVKEKPEFEDCRRISTEHDVSIREITDSTEREY